MPVLPPTLFWSTKTCKIFNAVNQKCYEDSLSILKEMYESENLAVRLGRFVAFFDTTDTLVKKLFESLVNFVKPKPKNVVA